jgi:hypothetical protein
MMLVAVAITALMFVSWDARAQVPNKAPLPVVTQPPATQPPHAYDPAELERIASPIALYPDPLLAQVLTASTFASQIPEAMQWVDGHRGASGQQLAEALAAERVAWDPSVQALVAFPTVLQMMASSMPWTSEIGDAFQTQSADVMDAVQRLRGQALKYGYLQSTPQLQVTRGPAIEIIPVNPAYVVVPYYDPIIVFAPPRPRFLVSTAIYLGFGVRLGVWYEPWGWRSNGFYWPARRLVGGYPGWNHPLNYRVPMPYNYHQGPRYVVPATMTPRGYSRPTRTAHETGTSARRVVAPDGRATPPAIGRSAQPRPNVEGQKGTVRESTRKPSAGGAHDRGSRPR